MIKIHIQFSKSYEREAANNIKKCLNKVPGTIAETEYNTAIEA